MNPQTPRLKLWRPAAYCLLFLVATQPASAAILRGQLQRRSPDGAVSTAPDIVVTVYNQAQGRSAPFKTGVDGMYSFNIPAGSYNLEVWTSPDPRVPPTVYPVTVVDPNTDIPPIVLP